MHCEVCHGSVSRRIVDMCYPKEHVCRDCGATYIRDEKGQLVLLQEGPELAIAK